MVTNKEKLFKLGKKMTDRVPYKLGLEKLTEDCPEYWGLVNVLDDEMVDIALSMKQRVPMTLEEIAKAAGRSDTKALEAKLQEMSCIGLLEYNWENTQHVKQYLLPLFVPGAAEFFNMRKDFVDEHPEVCDFFERMSRLPLEKVTPMVPLGGAGIGMHVVPVEKAIPADSQSVSIEHLSHWLKKYDTYAIGVCSCRRSQTVRGEGSGDLADLWCIAVGDCAKYSIETGKDGHEATYEEVMEVLQRAEDEGYVHQITNIDGEDKIFAICNCAPGVCYALRTSQLFNTPNMSRSAYIAHVDKENCVACGKCVEVCPAGAAKLGQKLCTKNGPVEYPKHELPDDNHWGPDKWDEDYRDNNMKNCYDSGTAPCKATCPAHIPVQGYIKLASEGRYQEALELIKKENPFPAVCGRICNKACEAACTRNIVDSSVAIDDIKKFIAEKDLDAEHRYVPKMLSLTGRPYTEKIAVIGAGPAGMSCAFYLALKGYPVTVFEKEQALGGMLTLGIPSFRLDKAVVNAEIDILKELGVEFRTGVEVGKDVTLDALRAEGYKAFYLGIGASKGTSLGCKGEELPGVYTGIDFLREVNLGKKPKVGKSVAVIGGGNVAIDVARSAARLGAKSVTVVYRRSEEEMPAAADEVEEARAEGVKFMFLAAPAEIIGEGKAEQLKVELMELGEPDAKGRRKPIGTGKFETIPATAVISAIGQKIDLSGIADFETAKNGAVIVDKQSYQTSVPDVFAGGDVVTGPKFAIDAIAAGKEGSISIHRYVHPGQTQNLGRDNRDYKPLDVSTVAVSIGSFDTAPRQKAPEAPSAEALKTFKDLRGTLTEEQIKKEAARCLGCGCAVIDEDLCIGCGVCTTKCKFDAIHLEKTMDNVGSTYYRTLLTAVTNAPHTIGRLAKKKLGSVKK